MDRFVRHVKPEQKNVEKKHHELRLLGESGEVFGLARLEYYGDPFPFYYLSLLMVPGSHEKQGMGSETLQSVNTFLQERDATGLLHDGIYGNQHAGGMYERAGWSPLAHHDRWYTYNAPQGLEPAVIRRAIRRAEPGNI